MPGGTGRESAGGSEWRKRDVIQGHHTDHSPVHAQAFDGALIRCFRLLGPLFAVANSKGHSLRGATFVAVDSSDVGEVS